MAAWYLIHTKASQEQVARENLGRQGFETYLPTINTARRRAGRWKPVVGPLFPGYLFVQLDVGQHNVGLIRSTRGVIGLVRFGRQLVPVPGPVIEGLVYAKVGDRQAPIEPAGLFKDGDPVCFAEGPLAGKQAIVCSRTGDEVVRIFYTCLKERGRGGM